MIALRRPMVTAVSYLTPFALLVVLWEVGVSKSHRLQFLFASPSLVFAQLLNDVASGALVTHSRVTATETILGLMLGSSLGASLGLALWASQGVARAMRPYVVALGAVPIFAIAPMTVIWFGTGLLAKVMMAALSTVFVALVQAYEGARSADAEIIALLYSFGASKQQVFRKVILPSALVWIMVSCRLNVGFALLGAFIGEFISSSRGLGHYVLRASGLYNVPQVLAGVLCIVSLSLVLTGVIALVEQRLLPWRNQRNITRETV